MRQWAFVDAARRTLIATAVAAAAPVALAPAPASAIDCSFGGCIDVAGLPAGGGVDLADILRRAQRFYGTSAKAYIVSSEDVEAWLPYMLPRQEPFVMRHQIHIPEIYHFKTEFEHKGQEHFVWHYIIGHEMAHVYQEERDLIEAMSGPFESVVLAELHADFMAGFFMASEFRMKASTIDNVLRELKELPTGQRGDRDYHGEPGERFFITTQGALAAFKQPRPTLAQASAQGVRCAFDLLTVRDGAQSLSEICR